MSRSWTVHRGDLRKLEVLKSFPDNHFDALLSDPPYGLAPDGRAYTWDDLEAKGGPKSGFMGKDWDAAVPGVTFWKEVLRVLKPGAPVLAFGGTRTYHRLVCAIEDAGFLVRDQIDWLYATGFPKSLDISKAIDKAEGVWRGRAGVPIDGSLRSFGSEYQRTEKGEPETTLVRAWSGMGTALKPAHEPVVLAMKPLEGTFVENVRKWGVSGLALEASRVGGEERFNAPHSGDGTNPTPYAPVNVTGYEGKAVLGRWPANVILSHDDRCEMVGTTRVKANPQWNDNRGPSTFTGTETSAVRHADVDGTEVVEYWECVAGCPVKMLDEQSGNRTSGARAAGVRKGMGFGGAIGDGGPSIESSQGGASRFFYVAKPKREERDHGCEDMASGAKGADALRDGGRSSGEQKNVHPTVKPIELNRYLARMVLPPARVGESRKLLVPFSGSGSEMIGALRAGWDEVHGIEQDERSASTAEARLGRWTAEAKHVSKIKQRLAAKKRVRGLGKKAK